ncbi:Thioredoxin [Macleaya cordata]|uniref:Thioredoxin n=1 Tax=Macleaya cordata TaxID=56857 RepID=A0A200Q909_MACCD|nr:Thioredoxin [Macleaya cordata]
MSDTIRISPCIQSLQHPPPKTCCCCCSSTGFLPIPQSFSTSQIKTTSLVRSSLVSLKKIDGIRGKIRVVNTWSVDDGPSQDFDSPVSVELKSIVSEEQFDRIISEAQQLEESVIIVWMASWCRKCIYLKPKLEKLAADYYPRVGFYCIDVNMVPYKLVTRAGVTLWKDGKKQAEVIGGHKAYLVVNEVREMIENECTL